MTYVLDAFALMAFFNAEPGGPRVRELLESRPGHDLRMSVINLAEVIYKTNRRFGAEPAAEVLVKIQKYPITFIDIDQGLALEAAAIKGVHPISYADCIAAALAQRTGATLLTGDPDFKLLEDTISIEWLKG